MRSPRATIDQREREQADLISALLASADPTGHDLADRLERCQADRERQRGWRTTTADAVRRGFGYRCRALGCWSCRRSITRRAAQVVHDRFRYADNHDASFVTIALARTGEIGAVREIVATARRGLRDRRDATARVWKRWREVEAVGYAEVDAVSPDDVLLLPPDRRALVPSLPLVGGAGDGPLWLPHLHLVVHHPGVDRGGLFAVLSDQWPGGNRVHVEDFHDDKLASENAGILASYGLKHFQSTQFSDDFVEPWPVGWSVSYFTWLHGLRRGLEPLRIALGPQAAKAGPPLPPTAKRPVEVAPMPVLIG